MDAKTKNAEEEAQQKMRYVHGIEAILQNRILINAMIQVLSNLMPREIFLHNLSLTQDRLLTIEGTSEMNAAVNQLQTRLVGSHWFKDVTLQYATKIQRADKTYTEFKITCQITGKVEEQE